MELSHVDEKGEIRMVDVGEKTPTMRTAVVEGYVFMKDATLELIKSNGLKKGDVLSTAKIAGISAAKRTYELIPLCHNIPLNNVKVDISYVDNGVKIIAKASAFANTGVEMEAFSAVSVAALTVYDMAKAVDREMIISDIKLMEKHGGKSGDFVRKQ